MYTIREIVICKQTKRINPMFKFDSRFDLNQLLDASVCSAALLMVVVLFFNFFFFKSSEDDEKRKSIRPLPPCSAQTWSLCVRVFAMLPGSLINLKISTDNQLKIRAAADVESVCLHPFCPLIFSATVCE